MAGEKYWKISRVVMVLWTYEAMNYVFRYTKLENVEVFFRLIAYLCKYFVTCDKSNIFTRDDHNHAWYFPIFFTSHILISQSPSKKKIKFEKFAQQYEIHQILWHFFPNGVDRTEQTSEVKKISIKYWF